jgi:hypothetical protein
MRCAVAFLVGSIVVASGQARVELVPTGDRRTILAAEYSGQIRWSAGAVRGVVHANQHGAPLIWSIDRLGVKDEFQVVVPELLHTLMSGVAAADDGSLAVIGEEDSERSFRRRFVARISPDHSRASVIDMVEVEPSAVTITPDGRMWTIGWRLWDDKYPRIRQGIELQGLDRSGTLVVKQAVRLKALPVRNTYSFERDSLFRSTLFAAHGRVGWLTAFGQYLEFDEGGRLLGASDPPANFKFDHSSATIALSDRGDVFLAMDGEDELAIWSLNKIKNVWVPVDLADDPYGLENGSKLLGFEGSDLIALQGGLERGGFLVRYRRRP